MIEIVAEEHMCVQSDAAFTCFVLVVGGRRIFATEDVHYLRSSRTLFQQEDDVAVVLDCDRNSAELPELGPAMDVEIPSPLYVRRLKESVLFQSGRPEERVTHLEAPLAWWIAAVQNC